MSQKDVDEIKENVRRITNTVKDILGDVKNTIKDTTSTFRRSNAKDSLCEEYISKIKQLETSLDFEMRFGSYWTGNDWQAINKLRDEIAYRKEFVKYNCN
jgi:hypothetical protein